jgi:hypothetical protein
MSDDPDALERIYTEIAAAYDRLSDALVSIDAKTVLVVGYALAASAFLATQHVQKALEILAYVSFGLAVLFAIFAYAVRNYQELEPRIIFNDYYDKKNAQLLRELSATRVRHYEHNKNLLHAKVRHWWRSLTMLILGTVLMISGILVHTGNHDNAEQSRFPGRAIHQSGRPGGSATGEASSDS